MEYIIDGFINNDTPFQLDFDNEDDARKEFELRKISCVEVNLSSSNGQEIDTFNKPFNVG